MRGGWEKGGSKISGAPRDAESYLWWCRVTKKTRMVLDTCQEVIITADLHARYSFSAPAVRGRENTNQTTKGQSTAVAQGSTLLRRNPGARSTVRNARVQTAILSPPLHLYCRPKQEAKQTLTDSFLLRAQAFIHALHDPTDDPKLLANIAATSTTTTTLCLVPYRRPRLRQSTTRRC